MPNSLLISAFGLTRMDIKEVWYVPANISCGLAVLIPWKLADEPAGTVKNA
jgi:hypothetical protein